MKYRYMHKDTYQYSCPKYIEARVKYPSEKILTQKFKKTCDTHHYIGNINLGHAMEKLK